MDNDGDVCTGGSVIDLAGDSHEYDLFFPQMS